jgi:hypothetical protein
MDVPGISRPALLAMIVVALLLFAFGSTAAVGLMTQHTDTHTRVLAARSTLVVDADTGDIRVRAADRADVRLTTKLTRSVWGGGRARVSDDGARLRLDDRCHNVPLVGGPCGISYVLEVPRATNVRIVTGTGDVHAEHLDGAADIRSSTGDLHVTGVRGPVRASADTGDVDVDSPAAAIAVHTVTGDIGIVATAPRSIRAEAVTGDVDVVVPDRTYAVEADSEVGVDHVGVRVDDGARRRVSAHTQTGDVHVEPGR